MWEVVTSQGHRVRDIRHQSDARHIVHSLGLTTLIAPGVMCSPIIVASTPEAPQLSSFAASGYNIRHQRAEQAGAGTVLNHRTQPAGTMILPLAAMRMMTCSVRLIT
jgi:hypothetical protein